MDREALIAAFEADLIPPADFPHELHVQVSWSLARRYGREQGLERLIAGIRGMAGRANRPTAYHVTVTRAWFELIASVDDLDDAPELFDKTIIGRYYSPERLAAGRERWLEPDLHPLRLPVPAPPSRGPVACERPDISASASRGSTLRELSTDDTRG